MGTVTMALLGMGMTALGGATQAQSEKATGEAQGQALSYQSMVARNNATMARRNAQLTSEQGENLATAEGMKTAAGVSEMKARTAASGVDVNTGSAVSARAAATQLGEINALTIRSNKAREAWGYSTEAASDDREAAMKLREAGFAVKGGQMSSDATLLSTAGSVVGQFSKMQTDIAGSGGYPTIGSGGMY